MLRFLTSRQVFLAIFPLLICSPVFAQRDRDTWNPSSPSSFEVSGEVRLADSGKPANRIPVRLERFGGGIVDQIDTDSSGRFRFPNLQRGYYRVVINAHGFRPTQQDADLQVLFRAQLLFELAPDTPNSSSGVASLIDVIDARVPATARNEFNRGREALANKNPSEAITHLGRAVEIYPDFFEAHVLIGTAHMDLREWQPAEAAFQRALAIKPDNGKVVLALGEALWREKRLDDAERALLDGLKVEDKNWHGYFTLARLYWDKNDVMKAAPAIGHTLQLRPDFAEAHLLAGNILLKLNQRERAIVEYQEYLRLAPKGEFADESRQLLKRLNAPLTR